MINLFVSSTFKDMHEERDLLHNYIIPEVNSKIKAYGETVSLSDLRWGIDIDEGNQLELNKKIEKVCLDEIDRCFPFMIVILGDCYGSEIENGLSVTEIEILHGILNRPEQNKNVLIYFRTIEGNCPYYYRAKSIKEKYKVNKLKKRITDRYKDQIKKYIVKWDDEQKKLSDINLFREMLIDDIYALVRDRIDYNSSLPIWEKERRLQDVISKSYSIENHCNQQVLGIVRSKFENKEYRVLILGNAGFGKSTIMSALGEEFCDHRVINIHCGTSNQTHSGKKIVFLLIHYFAEYLKVSCEYDFSKLMDTEIVALFYDLVNKYVSNNADKNVLILIDGIDQLIDDEYKKRMLFVPDIVSPKIKIVCTASTSIYYRLPLTEIKLPLENQSSFALDEMLGNRELSSHLRDMILQKKSSNNPLYLKILLHQFDLMNKEEYTYIYNQKISMNEYQKHIILNSPDDLGELIQKVIKDNSQKLFNKSNSRILSFIAISRYGLTTDAMESIAEITGDKWKIIDFLQLVKVFSPFFLVRPDGCYDFKHKVFRNTVILHTKNITEYRKKLISYLQTLDVEHELVEKELLWQAYLADEKSTFVDYVTKIKERKKTVFEVGELLYEILQQEQGVVWFCDLLENENVNPIFIRFASFELFNQFSKEENDNEKKIQLVKSLLNTVQKLDCLVADNAVIVADCLEKAALVNTNYASKNSLENAILFLFEAIDKISMSMQLQLTSINYSSYAFYLMEIADILLKLVTIDNNRIRKLLFELIIKIQPSGFANNKQIYINEIALILYLKAEAVLNIVKEKDSSVEILVKLTRCKISIADCLCIMRSNENLEKALQEYLDALILAERAFNIYPILTTENNVAVVKQRVGDVYSFIGGRENLREATKYLKEASIIRENLVRFKNNVSNKRDLAVVYEHLSELYMSQRTHIKDDGQLQILDPYLESAINQIYFGQNAGLINDCYKNANYYCDHALSVREALLEQIQNVEIKKDLCISYLQKGRLLLNMASEEMDINWENERDVNEKVTREKTDMMKFLSDAEHYLKKALNICESLEHNSQLNDLRLQLNCYSNLSLTYAGYQTMDSFKISKEYDYKCLDLARKIDKNGRSIHSLDDILVTLMRLSENPTVKEVDKRRYREEAIAILIELENVVPDANGRYRRLWNTFLLSDTKKKESNIIKDFLKKIKKRTFD